MKQLSKAIKKCFKKKKKVKLKIKIKIKKKKKKRKREALSNIFFGWFKTNYNLQSPNFLPPLRTKL